MRLWGFNSIRIQNLHLVEPPVFQIPNKSPVGFMLTKQPTAKPIQSFMPSFLGVKLDVSEFIWAGSLMVMDRTHQNGIDLLKTENANTFV